MNDSEMGLFGAYKSLLCLTIVYGAFIWDVRLCLGTTVKLFFCPYSASYSPYKSVKMIEH